MIELRGLHLGNIARSPAESVRPDLWPDHAWVPALGCQGNKLFDLAAAGFADLSGSPSWTGSALLLDGVNDYINTNRTLRNLSSVTVLWDGRINTAKNFQGIFCCRETADAATGISYFNGFRLDVQKDASSIDFVNTGIQLQPGQNTIAWRIANTSKFFLRDTAKRVSYTPTNQTAVDLVDIEIGRDWVLDLDRWVSGSVGLCSIYTRHVPDSGILRLIDDPLLPFRRHAPVFYSVPSGGGSSLAASSAWRVFTSAAIDTAWAIRAALTGATAWAVLTQSGADTGWRITAASDAATGWRIAADLDADTGWNLRAAADSPSAWRILTASEADTAWRIAADLNTSTAWAILTSLDAATAWAIISAGTLLANTSWAIRADADTDTGWRLKTDAAADTAWAVRNARDAATAWDVQAALAGATAWRIKTDLQSDAAWTVITDMDADAAWNILRADPTGTAWRVCTDLDTPTAWAVLSDIIPEPVRVFLAPGRQFIINAASRVLIITKTRP